MAIPKRNYTNHTKTSVVTTGVNANGSVYKTYHTNYVDTTTKNTHFAKDTLTFILSFAVIVLLIAVVYRVANNKDLDDLTFMNLLELLSEGSFNLSLVLPSISNVSGPLDWVLNPLINLINSGITVVNLLLWIATNVINALGYLFNIVRFLIVV